MRTPIAAISVILSLSACSTQSPDKPAASAGAPSIDTMKRLVELLSSDAYEGRAPGAAGEEKTLALLAKEFEEAARQGTAAATCAAAHSRA